MVTKSLISTIGKTLTSLACLLPIGCSTIPTASTSNPSTSQASQHPENIPPVPQPLPFPSNKDYQTSNQESNPLELTAYINQSVGDIVLNAGVHQGEFPSSYTDVGITASNDFGSLTAWKAECYTNQGEHAETDHGLTAIIPIKETNLSAKLGLTDWGFEDNTHHTVGVLGLNYNNPDIGFNASLTTLHALDDGGSLYVLPISQRLTPKDTKIPLSAKLKTTYSDGFLGGCFKHGVNHITPGLEAELYDNGITRVTAGVHHQFGLEDNIPTMWYGGVTVGITTPDLLGGRN